MVVWERMAKGDGDVQVQTWLDEQTDPKGRSLSLSRETIVKVRQELKRMPDVLHPDVPESVQAYWRELQEVGDSTHDSARYDHDGETAYESTDSTSRGKHEALREVVSRIKLAFSAVPPIPSGLWKSDIADVVVWRADSTLKEYSIKNTEISAIGQHLASVDLPNHLERFLLLLTEYEGLGEKAMQHIHSLLDTHSPPLLSPTCAVALFYRSADIASYASERHQWTWSSHPLPYLTMMNPKVIQDGEAKAIGVKMGPYKVASVSSSDQAAGVMQKLAELTESIPKEEPITNLVDLYFDIQLEKDKVFEYLSPLVVGKIVIDGRCEWCPSMV